MKKLPALLLCFTFSYSLFAQNTQRTVFRFPDKNFCQQECRPLMSNLIDAQNRESSINRKEAPGSFFINVPIPLGGEPFVAASVVWYSKTEIPDSTLKFMAYGHKEPDATFIYEYFEINEDVHAEAQPDKLEKDMGETSIKYVSSLFFIPPQYSKFLLSYSGMDGIDSVAIHFFNPGKTESFAPETRKAPTDGKEDFLRDDLLENKSGTPVCACSQPDFQSRQDWCPSGNCPPDPTPTPTTPTHLIVHHSAGANVASDWAAVVRSIWDFHVNTNGWDDIGYNWLVDPNGVLYSGRGNDLIGAHFCGFNNKTMGVCMIGDYTDIVPPAAAVNTLTHLLAWKACDLNLDPLGMSYHSSSQLTLDHISGHRDGCATSCPGDSFYPTLPQVRDAVQAIISDECDGIFITGPTTLTADAISGTQVDLEWTDNSVNETAFILERSSPSNANYQQIAELSANTTTHSDLGTLLGNGYFYRVKAVNADTESGYSNEVYVSTNINTDASALQEQQVRIFPNPTSGQTTFLVENQWLGTMNLTVFDALGRLAMPAFAVEKSVGIVSFKLDISAFTPGVFVIKIEQGKETRFFKLEKI